MHENKKKTIYNFFRFRNFQLKLFEFLAFLINQMIKKIRYFISSIELEYCLALVKISYHNFLKNIYFDFTILIYFTNIFHFIRIM